MVLIPHYFAVCRRKEMSKKRLVSFITVLAVICTVLCGPAGCTGVHASGKEEAVRADAGAEQTSDIKDGYSVKSVQIFRETLTDETVELRFYNEAPNVAYMGIGRYFDLMLGGGLQVESSGDGLYTLTNAAGAKAEADTNKGIVTAADLPAFENYYDDAREGRQSSFKDSAAPYLRLREVIYEGEPEPVTFDFGKLGIELYGDDSDVWFPVSILSTWFSDIAQNRVLYNGNYLYVCLNETPYELDQSYYSTEYYDRILTGGERASDLTAYSYGELGFIFRYIYGYPGTTKLDARILREEGLDEALQALGESGETMRKDLTSTDFRDFWFGMFALSAGPLEDGHNNTTLTIGVVDASDTEKYKQFREYVWARYDEYGISEFIRKLSDTNSAIYGARPEEYGGSGYYQTGDTAVIFLRSFSLDEEAWEEYYDNGGELPNDLMGTVAKGLRRASQDGGIRNVVFDVSTNPGGYSDTVMGALSLMTGRDYLCGYNTLSNQYFKVYFDVDRNLDGEINEEDEAVHYDFNYAVLTSRASFSCGNLFPFLVKEEGGMVIGEKSGGGVCSIQKAVLSEGFEISISGGKFKLTDNSGSDLEKGIEPDVPLAVGMNKQTNEITGEEMEIPDYSSYGDLDGICEAVSSWFSK